MADFMLTCDFCRHRMRVSEFQLGMAIVCPNCKGELAITEANTIPLEPKEPALEYEPLAAKTQQERAAQRSGVEHCERCDAIIRGDWDRYETDAGLWCNRCVNRIRGEEEEGVRVIRRGGAAPETALAAGPEPEYIVPPGVADKPLTREEILRQHTERAIEEEEAKKAKDMGPAFLKRYPRASRAVLWSLVAIVFFAALYYTFVIPEAGIQVIERQSETAEAIKQVPPGVRFSLRFAFWLLATIAPLYATLYIANKLPSGALIPDIIHVSAIALLLAILSFVTIVPLLGFILYIFLTAMILWSVYEMNLSDFITWAFMAFLLRFMLLYPLEMRILYALSQL